ncbi:MAG: ion transporter, partial [Gammaproteobacteria bacterium]
DPLYLRVVRLVRLFKLTRYSRSMDLLLTVLRKEANSLISAIAILVMLILLASAGIYAVESDDQPEAFGSIPRALWWATVTLTTVGYGDVVPASVGGRMLAMCISILGIGLAALPAGILASGFQRELDLRKRKYEVEAREALADGVVTRAERRKLNRERQRLGLEREEAREILEGLELELDQDTEGLYHCPHCGEVLDKRQGPSDQVPDRERR